MTKRSQTTGVPKSKPRPTAGQDEKKVEYKSRAEREAEIQRYVILGTIITVGVIVLILLAAIVVEFFITPNQPVARVNEQTITVADFETRVRMQRALLNQQINGYLSLIEIQGLDPNQFVGQEPLRTWLSQVQIPDQLGNSVINTMVDDLLMRQEAAELGITVSQEDIDRQIEGFFEFNAETAGQPPTETPTPTITPTPFVSPTPSPEPTITPTPAEATEEATEAVEATPTWTPIPTSTTEPTRTAEEQIQQFNQDRDTYFANLRRTARISDDDIRRYFETLAIREALRDEVTPEITSDALHASVRHILVSTQEEAEDLLAALAANESFAALAQAASTDTGSGAQGGELGWAPITDYVLPFAEAVAAAEIGEVVGPVESEFGFHIIQVHARENREITESQVENAKNRRFENYLEELRESEDADFEIFPNWVDHIPSEPVFIRAA